MLWILVIYLASAVFCIITLKDSIKEGLEDGDIDEFTADLMYTYGNILSFIPLLNTILSIIMLLIYAVHLIPVIEYKIRFIIWRVRRWRDERRWMKDIWKGD